MQISYYLPKNIIANEELSLLYEDWSAEKIFEKTGIKQRHISADNETVSDLAFEACNNLINEYSINKDEIEFIILATQTPDYQLPTTACIVQDRLGLSKNIGAFDINLGCSAYIYSLSIAKSLIENNTVNNVLLVMSEQYSKNINKLDKSTRTIFGDASSATLLKIEDTNKIGKFIFGTDGSGYDKLIIPAGGGKCKRDSKTCLDNADTFGNKRNQENIFMDGAEIFNFTINVVPKMVTDILQKNNQTFNDIDLFVFHQANKFMLDYLQKIIKIPKERFYIDIEDIGNTVSATIPIALKRAEQKGILKSGYNVMLVGFGVGLSWGATIIKW